MSAQIKVYSGNMRALGSTSKAFNVTKTEELMREYTLDFSVTNNDSIFEHISENSVFEFSGQKFDISGIDGNSGTTNITQITAEHISYRLADYTLPNGYSFVGTVRQIAEDILREAKTVDEVPASSAFSIGSTADLGTLNFTMSGATNVTARQALIAMSDLGVEIEFDNFTVNLPQSRGTDKGVVFKYSHNLNGVHRTWQRGNGWSYEISIVDLQKIPGYEGETYGIGDYITVEDTLSNLTLKKRIISYKECDDPTQNSVTVGVFVRDNASLSIETDRIANTANATAQNSVQQGERYSNVSITHTDGFKATSKDGTLRVMMNGDDCFAVQVKESDGTWKTVTSAELFGLVAARLATQNSKNYYYGTIGTNSSGNPGLFLMLNIEGAFKEHFSIWPSAKGDTVLDCRGDMIFESKSGGNIRFKNNVIFDADYPGKNDGISTRQSLIDRAGNVVWLTFKDGLLTGYEE